MKILIVDDEPLARDRLRLLVQESYPEAKSLEAEDGLQALEIISAEQPDIVLLDIRMPRMDGLEVAQHLVKLEQQPAIIFTTAYQDHAISAFDANAVDYLLKPIRQQRLQLAIERARTLNLSRLSAVSDSVSEGEKRSHVSAVINGLLELVPLDKIYYLKAEQKYVTAAWPGGEILLDDSLVSLEQEFPKDFIRIHRNALVSRKHIQGLGKNQDGQAFVKLKDMPDELIVSRRHLGSIKALLNEILSRS